MPSTALITLALADETLVTATPRRLDAVMQVTTPGEPWEMDAWANNFAGLRDQLTQPMTDAGIDITQISRMSELMILIACQEHRFSPISSLYLPS